MSEERWVSECLRKEFGDLAVILREDVRNEHVRKPNF
jgi:hypothetical protein